MRTVRRAEERGKAEHGWLSSRHTFSFAEYHDPRHMGFRALRVINEDRVAPGQGFGTHAHRDMEIISIVLAGALEHRDSLGNGSVLVPGDVQRMSAGTGVEHSEFNPSAEEPVHFLQIWIRPEARGLPPSYAQQHFAATDLDGRLRLVVSRDGRDRSLRMHQDADLYRGRLAEGATLKHALRPDRFAWLQVIEGELDMNGERLSAGDGVQIHDEPALTLTARAPTDVLLFDLA